jgi:hypothetical protein
MRPETNDTTVIEYATFGPYKAWLADVWKCPGCAVEIVTGFGAEPIRADHYHPDFPAWLAGCVAHSRRVVEAYEHPQPTAHAAREGG